MIPRSFLNSANRNHTFHQNPTSIAYIRNNTFTPQKKAPARTMPVCDVRHLVGSKSTMGSLRYAALRKTKQAKGDRKVFCSAILQLRNARASEIVFGEIHRQISVGLRPNHHKNPGRLRRSEAFAKQLGVEERIDVIELDISVGNVYEHSGSSERPAPFLSGSPIEGYNSIVSEAEFDPSLKIEIDD